MNKVKRTAAIIGVVLIASMYLISMISAFVATEYSNGLFLASIFTTFVVPVFIWFFLAFYKYAHKDDVTSNSEETITSADSEKRK